MSIPVTTPANEGKRRRGPISYLTHVFVQGRCVCKRFPVMLFFCIVIYADLSELR